METATTKHPKNEALRWFVYDHCGGPTKASFVLQVSAAAIHNWIAEGYVLSKEKAVEAANHCNWKVTPAQLLGVPEAPPTKGSPLDPMDDDEVAPLPKGDRARSAASRVADIGRLAEAGVARSKLTAQTRRRKKKQVVDPQPPSRAWTTSRRALKAA